ncbi:hypothetical protein HY441_02265 [Candidatus Microgenomates bacterium]|nr:hypothetical protein [Candidatus Microgenomates bacterium]
MKRRSVRRLRPVITTSYEVDRPAGSRRRRGRNLRIALAVLTLLTAAGLFWFGGLVSQVEVSASQHSEAIEQAIEQKFAALPWRRHLFWVSTDQLEQELAAQLSDKIAQISISKDWWSRKLAINVEDRAAVVRWQTAGVSYGLDQKGVITGGVSGGERTDLPLVIDSSNLAVSAGQAVSSAQFVAFVRETNQQLPVETNLTYRQARIIETTNELLVDTSGGFYIRLDTTRSSLEQLKTLKSLLNQGIKPTQSIDLRIPYKAYYR